MCSDNVGLHVARGGCVGSVTAYVALIRSSGAWQMVLDQCCSEAGDGGKLLTEV
jgi:hypothetical protein